MAIKDRNSTYGDARSDEESTDASSDSEHKTPLTADPDLDAPHVKLDEDTFGMTICSLVRDFHAIRTRTGSLTNKVARLTTTFGLLVGCLAIQIFLIHELTAYVASKSVHDIRITYDVFERKMYAGHTTETVNRCFDKPMPLPVDQLPHCHRGIPGHFNASLFWEFDDMWNPHKQQDACRIPLSQPLFFGVILFVWTTTCVLELRKCQDLFKSLVIETNSCKSMEDALIPDTETPEDTDFLVAALPPFMKVLITLAVILPRLLVTGLLIWLGCRWLLATTCFADLILNAVALEFILLMKDTLYLALVPFRNKLDLANLSVQPANKKLKSNLTGFVGTFAWAGVSWAWVFLYMGWIPGVAKFNGLQQVLPDYRWDVHAVCESWVKLRYMA